MDFIEGRQSSHSKVDNTFCKYSANDPPSPDLLRMINGIRIQVQNPNNKINCMNDSFTRLGEVMGELMVCQIADTGVPYS